MGNVFIALCSEAQGTLFQSWGWFWESLTWFYYQLKLHIFPLSLPQYLRASRHKGVSPRCLLPSRCGLPTPSFNLSVPPSWFTALSFPASASWHPQKHVVLLSCTCLFSIILLKASAGPSVIIQMKAWRENGFSVALAKGTPCVRALAEVFGLAGAWRTCRQPSQKPRRWPSTPKELREQHPGSLALATGLATKASDPAAREKPSPLQLHS